jgi:hypothetical protein
MLAKEIIRKQGGELEQTPSLVVIRHACSELMSDNKIKMSPTFQQSSELVPLVKVVSSI